jgi:hypothetical protein
LLVVVATVWFGFLHPLHTASKVVDATTEIRDVLGFDYTGVMAGPVWTTEKGALAVLSCQQNWSSGEVLNWGRLIRFSPDGTTTSASPWFTERPGQKALAPNGNLAIASQRYELTQEEKALIKPPEYKFRGLRIREVPVTAEALGAMWKEVISDLYLVQAGTERGQSLAQPAPEGRILAMAWSRDGQWLAAACSRPEVVGSSASVWLVPAKGDLARQRRLPLLVGFKARDMAWSPDGRLLALAGTLPDHTLPEATVDVELVLEVAKGSLRVVARHSGMGTLLWGPPCWSSDSGTLTLARMAPGVVVVDDYNLTTGKKTERFSARFPLITDVPCVVAWAPDRNAVALRMPNREHQRATKGSGGDQSSPALGYDLLFESAKGLFRVRLNRPCYLEFGAWSPDRQWVSVAQAKGLLFVQVPQGVW